MVDPLCRSPAELTQVLAHQEVELPAALLEILAGFLVEEDLTPSPNIKRSVPPTCESPSVHGPVFAPETWEQTVSKPAEGDKGTQCLLEFP